MKRLLAAVLFGLLLTNVALAESGLFVSPCGMSFCGDMQLTTPAGPQNPTSCAAVTDSDVQAWCTAVTFANTSGPELSILTTMVQGIKSDLSISTLNQKFDRFGIFALGNVTAASTELANRVAITRNNSPVFTANKGFNGTFCGTGCTSGNQYISSNFTPSTQGVNFTQNLNGWGIVIQALESNTSTWNVIFGASGGSETFWGITLNAGNASWGWGTSNAANAGETWTTTPATGRYAGERTGASAETLYRNGSSVNTGTLASGTLSARNVTILAGINSGSAPFHANSSVVGAYYFGTSLGATNVQKVDARLFTALHALSATFYP